MLSFVILLVTALATIVNAVKNNDKLAELDLSGNVQYLFAGDLSFMPATVI